MRKQDRAELAILTLSAVMGCGSGSGSGSGQSVAIDDLITELGTVDCASLVRCHLASDTELCLAVYGPLLADQSFNSFGAAVATAKAGKARYDGTAARACLDASQVADMSRRGNARLRRLLTSLSEATLRDVNAIRGA